MVEVAQAAGKNAKNTTFRKAEFKGKKDVVTVVDRENEELIVRSLKAVEPKISIWAEESGKQIIDLAKLAVIDPLDATRNFLGDLPYSVMIAYYEEKIAKFAVIYAPQTDETFTAELGKGAFVNGERIYTSTKISLGDALISVNRSNYPRSLKPLGLKLLDLLMDYAQSWRNFGTAGIEYSLVARGNLDGVITPMAEAVHAAGYLIMQEAGVKVTDFDGSVINLDSKMVVVANENIHSQLLELVQDARKFAL